ncbi:MAG: geranylgeranyl diphosphate synthase type II [Bacteroidia bacterium]|jgi:geranylgeranyl diphosphate synthase type II
MTSYQDLLKIYLKHLSEHQFEGAPDELYDPANYILGLGGKRVRPLLALIGYELGQKDLNTALPLAHAVEVFHNFTLMHDDIMDNADVRRGHPTVHQKWNTNIAILSGDLMLVKAYQLLNKLETDDGTKSSIIEAFGQMAEAVCVGQQYDMNFETLDNVSESSYIRMIECKTSVLLAFSLKAGGMLAGIDKSMETHLYDYGLNVGLAFQIMDDYLDTFGDQDSFGKRIGGDILENKKTLLWIEAKKRCSPEQLSTLNHWINKTDAPETKISAVTQLYKDLEVDVYAQLKMQSYFNDAAKHLAKIKTHYDTTVLESLATDLNVRIS